MFEIFIIVFTIGKGRVSQKCHALEKHAIERSFTLQLGGQEVKILPYRQPQGDHIGKFPSLYLSHPFYFLHRRGHNVLKVQLPSKEEHVILVRLSKIQRALYTEFMNRFRDAGNSGWLGLNPLKAFCVCCKVRFGRRCKKRF